MPEWGRMSAVLCSELINVCCSAKTGPGYLGVWVLDTVRWCQDRYFTQVPRFISCYYELYQIIHTNALCGRKILFHQHYNRSLLKVGTGTESKENVNVAPLYMECDIRKITHFPPSHPHPPQIQRPPFTQRISSSCPDYKKGWQASESGSVSCLFEERSSKVCEVMIIE